MLSAGKNRCHSQDMRECEMSSEVRRFLGACAFYRISRNFEIVVLFVYLLLLSLHKQPTKEKERSA